MVALVFVAVVGMVCMVTAVMADSVPLAIMGSSLFTAPVLMAVMFLVEEGRRKESKR